MERLLIILFCCIFPLFVGAKNLSPVDYGWYEAKTDLERYDVLMRTHKAAAERGLGVTYKGIKEVHIEIPQKGYSIPLSDYTDFLGTKIVVRNTARKATLFTLTNKLYEINLSKKQLETGDFRGSNDLRSGSKLLVIEDQKKWVERRRGYNNGATRKDVLLLKGGVAENGVIASYSDEESLPQHWWCTVSRKEKVIKNLVFERTADSDNITFFLSISNENNILVRNIAVITPHNEKLYGDAVLKFENCTNVKVEDVVINGTYSLVDKYGYGIGMNNVWNSTFVRLKADAAWGVFGNNNINHAVLKDCDINRFDVHCYGRDAYCKNTVFRNMYNQFSSFYGTLRFEECKFYNFVPILFESSYSAYSFFKIEIENSYIEVDKGRPCLIKAGNPSQLADKPRRELRRVSWPDIKMRNLTVSLPEDVEKWTIFSVNGGDNVNIYGMSEIDIDGLKIVSKAKEPIVALTNKKVKLKNHLKTKLRRSTISTIIREK